MTSAFQRDSSVVPDPSLAGRFLADIPSTWSAPNVPQGGISLAAATRAMGDALGDTPMVLRSVSCVFAEPVESGPAEIDVTVLRQGRSVAQVAATMRTPGHHAGLTAIAVFGAPRPGFEFTDVTPPEFPDPASLPRFRDGIPDDVDWQEDFGPFPIWQHHIEGRPVVGHPPWEHYVPSTSERQNLQRFDETPRLSDGGIDPLALVCLCDMMPGAVAERLGQPVTHDWYGPSADLTVHITGVARSEFLLTRNFARRATDGYASVEIELWDPTEGLVAYGTQTMIFAFADGVPQGDECYPLDLRNSRASVNQAPPI